MGQRKKNHKALALPHRGVCWYSSTVAWFWVFGAYTVTLGCIYLHLVGEKLPVPALCHLAQISHSTSMQPRVGEKKGVLLSVPHHLIFL